MSGSDIRKIKRLALRLGVHDSDIVRFAVKSMLARLEPLHDPEARGRSVLPVFVESGDELVRFFELDALRLDTIINDGLENGRRVDRDRALHRSDQHQHIGTADLRLQRAFDGLELPLDTPDAADELRLVLDRV